MVAVPPQSGIATTMRTRLFVAGGVTFVTLLAGVAVATSASAGTTTYEAEAAGNALTGGAYIADCRRCSGGKRVTAVGLLGQLGVTGVAAERAGATKVQVTYTSSTDRTALIRVNGAVATAVAFPSTRGDERTGTVRVILTLRAGDNTLAFANPAGQAPDIDKIVITTDGTPPIVVPTGTAVADPGVAASDAAASTLPAGPPPSGQPARPAGRSPSPAGKPGSATQTAGQDLGKPGSSSQTAGRDPGSPESRLEAQVVDLVNTERAKAGCRSVTADPRLTAAARAHSADMAARGYFDHTTPDNVDVAARITAAGFAWTAVAENIAKGPPSATAVMTSWVTNPGHEANIVNCGYDRIGVGVAADASGALLWTQDFGK
jgi:uncharacterized protein YkwD